MEGLRRVAGCGSFGAEVLDPDLPSETLSAALHTHGFLLFRHPTHPLAGLSASGLVDFVAERFPRLRANRNGAKNAVDGVVGTLGNTIDPESGLFSSDFMPAVGMAEVRRPHYCMLPRQGQAEGRAEAEGAVCTQDPGHPEGAPLLGATDEELCSSLSEARSYVARFAQSA